MTGRPKARRWSSGCTVSVKSSEELDKDWKLKVPVALADDANLEKLRDPAFFLPNYGTVLDQEYDVSIPFKAGLCPPVQHSILKYTSELPRTESGHTKFLAVVASRQTTKTTTAALALSCKAMYNPGSQGVTIADDQDRADVLFEGVMYNYSRLPDAIKMPQLNTTAVKHLKFPHGGSYRALTSGFSGNTGLGRGIAYTHISEGPFHKDFASFWTKYLPAIINRKNAAVIVESTPGAMSEPSSPAYRDLMAEARQGIGRWAYVFAGMWTSRLNERPWNKDWKLSLEETRLLELYGRKDGGNMSDPGNTYVMTLENLAFLREVRVMDPKIRDDPSLVWVFYPKDDISCWHVVGNSAFPSHAMESLLVRSGGADALVRWEPADGMYQEYQAPRSDAIYVIGVDPSGWGSGDPSSFQVLEVWADEVRQVAEFESNRLTPPQFAQVIIGTARRYNDAEVYVESNGVGGATLAVLELAFEGGKLENLFYYTKNKPGVPNSVPRHDEALAALVAASLDVGQGGNGTLIIHGVNLQAQLGTYRQDKAVQQGVKTLILKGTTTSSGRREKHHWDRVSALLWAMYGVQFQKLKSKPRFGPDRVVIPSPELGQSFRLGYKKPSARRDFGALLTPKSKRRT